jgi:hypothetical protein
MIVRSAPLSTNQGDLVNLIENRPNRDQAPT